MNIDGSSPGTSLRIALATAAIAAACVAAPTSHAESIISSNGGAACKASNGNGAKLFYFSNQYAENTSTANQYLTCHVPQINPGSSRSASTIEFLVLNTGANPATFTCVITAGYFPETVTSAVYTIHLAANGLGGVNSNAGSTPAIPLRGNGYTPYDLNCLVPPGGRMGIISSKIPETI